MHQTSMLSRHREQYLLERIRVIIDQSQHSTEIIYEMVKKPPINVGLYSVYEDGKIARYGCKGISSRGFN